MSETLEKPGVAPLIMNPAPGKLQRRLKLGYFILEGLNALAAAYYFNYLFFYMEKHFGFGNRNNLLITGLYGFMYMFAAWTAGRLVHKYGYFFFLRAGFSVVLAAMIAGGLIPVALGYSHAALYTELGLLVVWTLGMCVTWPTLQGLLSQHESRPKRPEQRAFITLFGRLPLPWLISRVARCWTGSEVKHCFGSRQDFTSSSS